MTKMINHTPFTQTSQLEKLEAFEAPFLEQRLLQQGIMRSAEEYRLAFEEFKRFVALRMQTKERVGMVSHRVDAVWEGFILFTREYETFCTEIVGTFLHHRVLDESTPFEARIALGNAYLLQYEKMFGHAPRLVDASAAWCCSD